MILDSHRAFKIVLVTAECKVKIGIFQDADILALVIGVD
jgi:hypothetical protein